MVLVDPVTWRLDVERCTVADPVKEDRRNGRCHVADLIIEIISLYCCTVNNKTLHFTL